MSNLDALFARIAEAHFRGEITEAEARSAWFTAEYENIMDEREEEGL